MRYVGLLDRAHVKNLQWLWLSLVVIVLDQITKLLITHHLFYGESIPILSILDITLVYNRGSAFGFLNQANGWQIWFFVAIALTVSMLIIIWLYRLLPGQHWLAGALSLILGGALGNLIDRLQDGYVIDFIHFHINEWYWPDFNIADSAICIGAFILAIYLFRK